MLANASSFLFLQKRFGRTPRTGARVGRSMNLRGKTRLEIEAKLANASRAQLFDLVYSLVSLEIHLRPSEVAQRTGINKRAVLRALRTGALRPYLAIADNSIRIPI